MANLNTFGFQVCKSPCDAVPRAKSSADNPKEQQNLPWHLPPKGSLSNIIPSEARNSDLPLHAQQEKHPEKYPHSLKRKCTPSAQNHTITNYFQKAPSAATVTAARQAPSEQYKSGSDIPEYCSVKRKIPFTELWAYIIEDLHSDCSVDSLHDDDLETIGALSVRAPRGLRRKARDDDDNDDGDSSRRNMGKAKMVRRDLVSAFQQVLTFCPASGDVRMMDLECEISEDDESDVDECLERPVRHRMSVAEAGLLFQHIADELLMY
ncbi:hypothetical protein BX666DRAFT_1987721 [Dichotomocladium elegans]|nr:hypothetical protein BX666DRAFT_1987721 [Dichotomocladium elegans]